ncbi:unnamed protein product [Brassica rapa]|uniref:Uncharacterized protein n=1 Tax=Brassica campestris TaxID=3711 RepID=A0A8D9DBM5_BRACM|nr:unnamed protein product [Brassica rapa]CAG7895777.1 unnamed protein product [Brassica rapa]
MWLIKTDIFGQGYSERLGLLKNGGERIVVVVLQVRRWPQEELWQWR